MPTTPTCIICGKPSQLRQGRCPACYARLKTKYSIRLDPATNEWEVVMSANGVESVRRRCATHEEASRVMLQFAGHHIERL